MEKRQCEYFLAIAREKNISKAAEKLYISQPSLSKFLIGLEKELGKQLFVRNRNQLEITEAGKIYLRYARKFLALENKLSEELSLCGAAKEEKITLGITPWINSYITLRTLNMFLEEHPQIMLNISEDFGQNLFSMFLDGTIDLVFSNVTSSVKAQLPSHCTYIPVMKDRLLIVVPKSISEAHGIFVSDTSAEHPHPLSDLPFHDCRVITGKPRQHLYTITMEIMEAYHLSPSGIVESQNVDNCLNMVESGHGISFVSEIYIKNGPKLNHSDIFCIDDETFDYTRYVICDKRKSSPEREDLIRIIKEICREIQLRPL
ncbi:MAG: LysR family transcriptional regulator [Firmicutes bacterium]|nr:LysR family transcriptional regulator [Lachnospiraceae bacterium]MBQ8589814.1 LysR family transcriptional regulator [Bacillota bacterium]